MTCNLSDTVLYFHESGIKIRPLSLDIRHSRREDDQFDHVQAKVSREAGDHLEQNAVHHEPVTVQMGGHHPLYRGYFTNDAISLGAGTATLEISDPRRMLRNGYIDKEWNKITLKDVVDYIVSHRTDPYGVITGMNFITPKEDDIKLQFEDLLEGDNNTWANERENISDTRLGITNFIRETTPLMNGDGQFDFREESPYSAMEQVADIWETDWFVDHNGTLQVGNPDLDANVYASSRYDEDWYITQWNLPQNPTPLKGVYVKGKKDHKGGHDDNALENVWQWATNEDKFETRAYCGFVDSDLEETLILDKKNTSDPETLKEIAKRGFLKRYMQNNQGSLLIDALASRQTDVYEFCNLKIGDRLLVRDGWGCGTADPGLYEVHSIQHKISGGDGWTITIQVTQEVTKDIETKFWYYDPTDPDMAQDGGAP